MAHAPKPTGVISKSEFPSFLVSIPSLAPERARTSSASLNRCCLFLIKLDEREVEKLSTAKKFQRKRSICRNCCIERNGFAVRVGDSDLLRALSQSGSCDRQCVGI